MLGTGPTLRWAILGVGQVCDTKSGPAFYKVPNSRLVAVMRRDGKLCEEFAKRHGVPKWYTDAEALVRDPEVDAVYIATPPGLHKEHALLCAKVGKPCLVEKPMARNAAECKEILAAFEKRNLPIAVAFYRRHLLKFEAAHDLIKSGRLGPITGVRVRFSRPPSGGDGWRVAADVAGGGLFMDLGSHQLDLLDWLVGPLDDVFGIASRLGDEIKDARAVEDNVRAIFKTSGGTLGVGEWNFNASYSEDVMEVMGTEASLRFSCFKADQDLTLTTKSGEVVEYKDLAAMPPHVHLPLIDATTQDFLRAAERRREAPDTKPQFSSCRSTGESALRTAVVMDKILSSYYKGRDDDFWTRPATWGT